MANCVLLHSEKKKKKNLRVHVSIYLREVVIKSLLDEDPPCLVVVVGGGGGEGMQDITYLMNHMVKIYWP